MNEAPDKGGYIRQAWLVILLALLYGAALAGVETTLGPIIEQNKKNETYRRIPELVGIPEPLSDADRERIAVEEKTVQGAVDNKPHRVYQAFFDGTHKGWVLPAGGPGFADRIDLLIGLSPDLSTITGLYVLDQKETPGLGDNITDFEKFRKHFKDQPSEPPLELVKPSDRTDPAAKVDGQIVAITAATISSESVTKIVNEAVANLKEPLRGLLSPRGPKPDAAPRGRGG